MEQVEDRMCIQGLGEGPESSGAGIRVGYESIDVCTRYVSFARALCALNH